jgi:HK97 family phage prohead protease
MDTLQFKDFQIQEVKQEGKGLTISGYGAMFGNIDSYGDIIEKGAFAETIAERKERIAFCSQHDITNPIGKILDIKEDEKGLWIEVKISDAEEGIKTKVREGILKEMSIGYRTVDSKEETRDGKQVNILTKIKLYEISLVTVAANPLAIIEGMKAE